MCIAHCSSILFTLTSNRKRNQDTFGLNLRIYMQFINSALLGSEITIESEDPAYSIVGSITGAQMSRVVQRHWTNKYSLHFERNDSVHQ
jgi:hypothetical protein